MHRALVTATLIAGGFLAGTSPSFAAGGRVTFTGTIVEASCPVRGDQLDCPAGRQRDAVVRAAAAHPMQGLARMRLLDYALHRGPSRAWKLVEVTYR